MAIINGVFIDDITAQQIPRIVYDVMKRDRDKHIVVDGREGTGKSVLAMQLAKALDKDFDINKIAFNSETFIRLIKDPARKKGDCLLLDEAFSSASARASLSQINRAMMTVATEMRQLNLFIIIVLPSIFDLDRYFALWRCETLFHVYYNKRGMRGQYLIFPFNKKKNLYLKGKKTYNYSAVKSPYPPCRFSNTYIIDEQEYRLSKAKAFRKRTLDRMEMKYKERIIILIKYLNIYNKMPYTEIGKIIGISEKGINKMVERYNRIKLIEQNARENRFLGTTK